LEFLGYSGKFFFGLLKKPDFPTKLIFEFQLYRIDIYFEKKIKTDDILSNDQFFNKFKEYASGKNRSTQLIKITKGTTLSVGHRRSFNYYRIYFKNKTKYYLKFELELKHPSFNKEFNNYDFQEFERKLTDHFVNSIARISPIETCQLDWLAIKLRRNQQNKLSFRAPILKCDYLVEDSNGNRNKLIRFSFHKVLTYHKQCGRVCCESIFILGIK
jgi:hypothetical protein